MQRWPCCWQGESPPHRESTAVMLPSSAQTGHCHRTQSPSDQALPLLAGDKQRLIEHLLSACRGPASGLTIAEQIALLQQAKAQAEAGEPDQSEAAALPPAVRVLPLGEDRWGALYWKLPCSIIMAGADGLSRAGRSRVAKAKPRPACAPFALSFVCVGGETCISSMVCAQHGCCQKSRSTVQLA